MPTVDETDSRPDDRRFEVGLFIVHPILVPSEITKALDLAPQRSHGVGDQRRTPKGTLLPGTYPDTRWRYTVECTSTDQWFAEKIDNLLRRLEPHKPFLRDLCATGGRADLIISFLDGYYSDVIASSTVARMVDLGLSLGIQVYTTLPAPAPAPRCNIGSHLSSHSWLRQRMAA